MLIQGVLCHSRSLDLYRSFPNLKGGSNSAIHCWLLSLEKEYKSNKNKLPSTLYHQIDGGSENTAKATLAVAELLVARRLTKRVVISRLPVGHTHEDIDSVFGLIWTKMCSTNVFSPKQYKDLLFSACKNKEKKMSVIDLWSVPDYDRFFSSYINPDMQRYAKLEWSQLQIMFEATDAC